MKTLSIFKKLINFYYYLSIVGFIAGVIALPILFHYDKIKKIDFIENYDISDLSIGGFLVMLIIALFFYYQFIKAIHLFRNCFKDLCNGNYFSGLVISNFKKIGIAFLIGGIGLSVYKFILRLLLVNDIKLGINNLLLLSLIFGLFFMFLSEVFAKAKLTKEENDLTI